MWFPIVCAIAMLSGFAIALLYSGRLGWRPKRRRYGDDYDDPDADEPT
ncbi:MAG: hypothetical protein ACRDQ1_12045 [Sciscionella sp.]